MLMQNANDVQEVIFLKPAFMIAAFFVFVFIFVGCTDKSPIDPLTTEERAWLSEHDGKIRLGHDPDAKPIEYIDENGKFNGLAADYVRLIEKTLNFHFDIVSPKTWDEAVKRAKNKEIDVLCAFTKTGEREQWMLFTKPYLIIPIVILTRNDFEGSLTLDEIQDMKVTFTKGWVIDAYLTKEYSHINMLPAIDPDAAMENLITKKADVWITALTVASNKIEDNKVSNLRIAGKTKWTFKLAMASRKDWPILHSILEKGSAQISEKTRSDISAKWIHLEQQSIFKNRTFWIVILTIIAIALLSVIASFSWNRTLKRKVEEKTEALSSSEKEFRQLAEAMPQMVWITRPDGWNIYFNQQWVDYTGMTLEESYRHGWNKPFHPEDQQRGRDTWQNTVKNDAIYSIEVRLRRFDGEYFWWLIRAVPLLDEKGAVQKWFGTCTDIEEIKQAEKALQESQSTLKAALTSMTDAVSISDTTGHYIEFNDAFVSFHKFESRVACFENLADYPDIMDVFMDNGERVPLEMWPVSRALRGETATNTVFKLLFKRTGETRIGSYSFSPIRDTRGEIVGSVVVRRDITESRKAETEIRRLNAELEQRVYARTAQLEAANKELEAFSYSVSHDLRAPLRHINGYVALLNNQFREALPDKAVDYLNTIANSSIKMSTLIDDLLQFSRTGRQEMRQVAMDMNVLVEEVLEELKPDVVNRNISWTVAELPKVFGDRSMLKQVWVNLLANAVKFTRNKDKADIEVGFTQEPTLGYSLFATMASALI